MSFATKSITPYTWKGRHNLTCQEGRLTCRYDLQKTAGYGGITAVAIRGGGGSWGPMDNKYGSAWEVGNAPGLPWDFQFTSDSGQTVSTPPPPVPR